MIGSGKARKNTIKGFIPNSKHGHESEIEAYLLPKAHVLYFGSSGSGKTDTVQHLILLWMLIQKIKSFGLVFDSKGELYQKIDPY